MGIECWGPGEKCAKLFAEASFRKFQKILKILTTAKAKEGNPLRMVTFWRFHLFPISDLRKMKK